MFRPHEKNGTAGNGTMVYRLINNGNCLYQTVLVYIHNEMDHIRIIIVHLNTAVETDSLLIRGQFACSSSLSRFVPFRVENV